MSFLTKVERWRAEVQSQMDQRGYPWAVEFVLALMQRESGGIIGNTNSTSGASGLMQVMPISLQEYNNKTGSSIQLSTLRATNMASAPTQIKVGMWILASYWKSAYKWLAEQNQNQNIPIDELAKFSDAFYHAGANGMKGLSQNLPRPIRWADWQSGHPNNKITVHANAVWANSLNNGAVWNMTKVYDFVQGGLITIPTDPTSPKMGFVLAIIIFVIGSYLLKGGKK